MNSWIPSFSSVGTSFRPHMHGEKFSSVEEGHSPVPDLDLEIWRRVGGGGGWGVWAVSKLFFQPFGPYFGLKIREGGSRAPRAPPLDPSLSYDPTDLG